MRKTICLLFFCLLLGACSPLHYKIYLLNHSRSPITLTLIGGDDFRLPHDFYVHSIRQLVPIKKNTREDLTDSLPVLQTDRQTLRFTIPGETTVYLTDLFPLTEHRRNNRIIIDKAGGSDTLDFNYPYRHTPQLKRTGLRYSLFYRLICRIDMTD